MPGIGEPTARKPNTLNSWKEIACYLGRGVRTVQRWESELQLPAHRIGIGDRSPVFAFKAELDNWMREQAGEQRLLGAADRNSVKPDHIAIRRTTLDTSAQLTSEALLLLERQQAQTKLLAQQVQRMAHLVPNLGKFGLPSEAQKHSPITRRRAHRPPVY